MMKIWKMTLQLFADVQTTLLEGLSAEMKTFYDMTLIDEAAPALVHDQFGQKRPIPKNGGKIIEFRKFAPLTKALTPLTEGVTPEGKSLDVTTINAEVSQYGDYIVMSDILELTAIDNVVVEALKLLGRQGGATLDTVVRNILHTGTNVMYCPKIAADGSETEVKSRDALDNTCRLTVKAVQKAEKKQAEQDFYASIEVGQKFVGTVRALMNYGAFVNIGPVDGMVHISELSWGRLRPPAEVLTIGQKLNVFIKGLSGPHRFLPVHLSGSGPHGPRALSEHVPDSQPGGHPSGL